MGFLQNHTLINSNFFTVGLRKCKMGYSLGYEVVICPITDSQTLVAFGVVYHCTADLIIKDSLLPRIMASLLRK